MGNWKWYHNSSVTDANDLFSCLLPVYAFSEVLFIAGRLNGEPSARWKMRAGKEVEKLVFRVENAPSQNKLMTIYFLWFERFAPHVNYQSLAPVDLLSSNDWTVNFGAASSILRNIAIAVQMVVSMLEYNRYCSVLNKWVDRYWMFVDLLGEYLEK